VRGETAQNGVKWTTSSGEATRSTGWGDRETIKNVNDSGCKLNVSKVRKGQVH